MEPHGHASGDERDESVGLWLRRSQSWASSARDDVEVADEGAVGAEEQAVGREGLEGQAGERGAGGHRARRG